MKQIFLILLLALYFTSCEEDNIKDIAATGEIQLNNIQKIILTNDNGLLISGEYESKTTFIRTDANFRILWRKDNFEWGENKYGRVVNMFQNESGNFICVAYVSGGGCVVYPSAKVIELSQKGEELKNTEFQDITIYDAIKTVDDGYLMYGTRALKVDNRLKSNWRIDFWSKKLGLGKVLNIGNGRYALTCNYNGDELFLKLLDNSGNETESLKFCFNDPSFNEIGYDLNQLKDKGFIIAGRTRNIREPFDMDCGVTRISSSGEKIWTKKFGTGSDEWLENFIYSSGNMFIIQGKVGFPNAKIQQSVLIKIDLNGQISDSCTIDRIETLLYNPHGYFIKGFKFDDNNFRFTKVPFDNLFMDAGKN